uniref:Uncharacterized protein n=1 Tax=Glossina pallidipes TaxID=7398 RepID=A0A1A9ZAZ0_GLOPL
MIRVSATKHNRSWKRRTRATAYYPLIYCQKYTLSHCHRLLLPISERSLEKQFHKLKPFSKSLTGKSPQLIARLIMKFFATFNTLSEGHNFTFEDIKSVAKEFSCIVNINCSNSKTLPCTAFTPSDLVAYIM